MHLFTRNCWFQPSFAACIDVNIILAIANCNNGVCPQKNDAPGNVLYAGPFLATEHPDGLYQNFSLQVPQYMSAGPAAFSLRRRCLLQVCRLLVRFCSARANHKDHAGNDFAARVQRRVSDDQEVAWLLRISGSDVESKSVFRKDGRCTD